MSSRFWMPSVLAIAAAVAVAGCGGAADPTTPTAAATPEPILTAAPSPTPSPTLDPSPTPTARPSPTVLPVRTATPEPDPSRTPRPTPEPEATPALNKNAKFATFAIDYASPAQQGTYDFMTWTANECDPIPIKCPDFWNYTIRFRALPGKSPGVIDQVRTRIYDTDGKEWYPAGQKDFGPIEDARGDTVVIDFKPGGTDSYFGVFGLEWLGVGPDFHGARVQLEFKRKGSSAVAKISFVLAK